MRRRNLLVLALLVTGCGDAGGSPYGDPVVCDQVWELEPDDGGPFYIGRIGVWIPQTPGTSIVVTGCYAYRIVDGVHETPLEGEGDPDGCVTIFEDTYPEDTPPGGSDGVTCEDTFRNNGITTVRGYEEVYVERRTP